LTMNWGTSSDVREARINNLRTTKRALYPHESGRPHTAGGKATHVAELLEAAERGVRPKDP